MYFINKKKNKSRKVLVYGVYQGAVSEKTYRQHAPITITSTRDEALLSISKILYKKHRAHYEGWCEIRGLAPGFASDSWIRYLESVVNANPVSEDRFSVLELYYSTSDIAGYLRMLTRCEPLILPHELDQEISNSIYAATINDQDCQTNHTTRVPDSLRAMASTQEEIDRLAKCESDVSKELWSGHKA